MKAASIVCNTVNFVIHCFAIIYIFSRISISGDNADVIGTIITLLVFALSFSCFLLTMLSFKHENKKNILGLFTMVFNSFLGGFFYLFWDPSGAF